MAGEYASPMAGATPPTPGDRPKSLFRKVMDGELDVAGAQRDGGEFRLAPDDSAGPGEKDISGN
jgi:hypothetical protein